MALWRVCRAVRVGRGDSTGGAPSGFFGCTTCIGHGPDRRKPEADRAGESNGMDGMKRYVFGDAPTFCTDGNTSDVDSVAGWRTGRFRGKTFLRGSTLAETLVMMLVSGIVLLAVTEGLALFFRLQIRQAETLFAAECVREGFYRTEWLVTFADSVTNDARGFGEDVSLRVWRNGCATSLRLSDSVLLYTDGGFRDTLLRNVSALRLMENEAGANSVAIRFGTGLTARFHISATARERHRIKMEEIENGYGYKEE